MTPHVFETDLWMVVVETSTSTRRAPRVFYERRTDDAVRAYLDEYPHGDDTRYFIVHVLNREYGSLRRTSRHKATPVSNPRWEVT